MIFHFSYFPGLILELFHLVSHNNLDFWGNFSDFWGFLDPFSQNEILSIQDTNFQV